MRTVPHFSRIREKKSHRVGAVVKRSGEIFRSSADFYVKHCCEIVLFFCHCSISSCNGASLDILGLVKKAKGLRCQWTGSRSAVERPVNVEARIYKRCVCDKMIPGEQPWA